MITSEMLLDIMSDVDPVFIDEHMERSSEGAFSRIRKFAVPVAIYAAACIAVMLILPHIIKHGSDPAPTPGDDPIVIETIVSGSETEITTEVTDDPELPVGITEFNGCEYTITLDRTYYTVNDTINATVVLENKGNETIGLYQGYLGSLLDEVVFYENGEERRSFSSDYGKGYNEAILAGLFIPGGKIVFNVQFTPGSPLDSSTAPADPDSDWTITAYLSYYTDPDTTSEDAEPDFENMKTASVSVVVPHDRETPATVEVTTDPPETTVTTPEITTPPSETTTTTPPPPETTTTMAPPVAETAKTTSPPEPEPIPEPKGMEHFTDGVIPYSLITCEGDLSFAMLGSDKSVEPTPVYTSAEDFRSFTDKCREAITQQPWLTSILDSWEYFNEDFFEEYNLYLIMTVMGCSGEDNSIDGVSVDKDGNLVININRYEYTGGSATVMDFKSYVLAVKKEYTDNTDNVKYNNINYKGFFNEYTRKTDYVLESELNKNGSSHVTVCPKCGKNTLSKNVWVNAINYGYVQKGYITIYLKTAFRKENYNKIYVESDDPGSVVKEMCFPDIEVEGVKAEKISPWMVDNILNGTYKELYPISILLSDTSIENIKAVLESMGCWYCSDYEGLYTPY